MLNPHITLPGTTTPMKIHCPGQTNHLRNSHANFAIQKVLQIPLANTETTGQFLSRHFLAIHFVINSDDNLQLQSCNFKSNITLSEFRDQGHSSSKNKLSIS